MADDVEMPDDSKADAKPAAKPAAKAKTPAKAKADPKPAVAKAKTPAKAEAPAKSKAKDPAEEAAEAPKPKRAASKKPAADKPKPNEKAKPTAAKPKAAKRAKEQADGPPTVRAQAKYVRTSARKARLVCDNIRGKSVDEARAILAFTPRAVAKDWSKLLNSAVANAEHNHELVGDDLRVATAYADEGPTLKRFRPRAMGRATPIRKRTSHLTITLTPKE